MAYKCSIVLHYYTVIG